MKIPVLRQRGFTLLELIITIVVAAFMGTMAFAYFGSALTQSGVPISRLQNATNLQMVMERIIGDYERLDQINMRFKHKTNHYYRAGSVVYPEDNPYLFVATTSGTTGAPPPQLADDRREDCD